jgi:hypothetical protein
MWNSKVKGGLGIRVQAPLLGKRTRGRLVILCLETADEEKKKNYAGREKSHINQEAAESMTSIGQHLSNRLKFIYSESWRRELLIGTYMSQIGGGAYV